MHLIALNREKKIYNTKTDFFYRLRFSSKLKGLQHHAEYLIILYQL